MGPGISRLTWNTWIGLQRDWLVRKKTVQTLPAPSFRQKQDYIDF